MKILLLGFPDYLSNLISNLEDTPFLLENHVDIMFAESSVSKKRFDFKLINRLKNITITKIAAKSVLSINLNSHKKKIDSLFHKVDISFIDNYSNVKILKYLGIDNIDKLEEYDFMIVATFGKKIPSKIFNMPKRRTLNIHPSYLPELRGGYPTYVEAYKSSNTSGTTIHYMEDKWDNGAVIIQKRYKVDRNMNNNDRFLLSSKYAAFLLNDLHEKKYNFIPVSQSVNCVSYCHEIIKPKTELKQLQKSDDIQGIVRANYAKHLYPFTYLFYNFRLFSIIEIIKISDTTIIPLKYIDYNLTKVFRLNGTFILNFYGTFYEIKKFIYQGKLNVH